jgi:hypothetical protein
MFRISIVQVDSSPAILRLEGKLLEPWIGELHEACRKAFDSAASTTLDLTGLLYVDKPGTIALRDLKRRGIKLTGCSPLIAELLREPSR